MRNLVAALVAVAVGLAAPAHAADPYDRASVKDAPVYDAPAPSWTGVYVGVFGGIGNTTHELSLVSTKEGGEELLSLDGIADNGFVGGVELGLDKQIGTRLLIGLRGQYSWSNARTELASEAEGVSLDVLEQGEGWNLVGRIGFLLSPDTMAYVLGGYGETEYRYLELEKRLQGYIAGGGLEHRLSSSDFYANLEYSRTFYDKEAIADLGCYELNDEPYQDRITAGLKYKPSFERSLDSMIGF